MVFSVAGSAIVEILFQVLRVRGRVLHHTVMALLGEPYAQMFYDDATVRGLTQIGTVRTWVERGREERRQKRAWTVAQYQLKEQLVRTAEELTKALKKEPPETGADESSNLPTQTADVLERMERWHEEERALARRRGRIGNKTVPPSIDYVDAGTFSKVVVSLGKTEPELRKRLAAFGYGDDLQTDLVAAWFEQAMRATKRQYRRSVQMALFFVGLAFAFAFEMDSIARTGLGSPDSLASTYPVFGYLLTAAAVALGTQYWFDATGKLLGLRSQALSAKLWGKPAQRP